MEKCKRTRISFPRDPLLGPTASICRRNFRLIAIWTFLSLGRLSGQYHSLRILSLPLAGYFGFSLIHARVYAISQYLGGCLGVPRPRQKLCNLLGSQTFHRRVANLKMSLPPEDEYTVNAALIGARNALTMHFKVPMEWTLRKNPFYCKNATGAGFEARVVGYLRRTGDDIPLAILEVKFCTRNKKNLLRFKGKKERRWQSGYAATQASAVSPIKRTNSGGKQYLPKNLAEPRRSCEDAYFFPRITIKYTSRLASIDNSNVEYVTEPLTARTQIHFWRCANVVHIAWKIGKT